MNLRERRASVVGGGWSGLACALRLADAGVRVALHEAAPQLGGRARRVELALGDRRYALDNGQHLLVGAYSRTLALLERIGSGGSAVLRLPFQVHYADGYALRAARLPAPLHLLAATLGARGMHIAERMALMHWALRWRVRAWRVTPDRPASELFIGTPARLVQSLWEPLCLAALNVRLADGSAQIFLNVLRDTIGAAAAAADFVVPRHDLGRLVPDAAAQALKARQAEVHCGDRIERLGGSATAGWHLHSTRADRSADAVVLALPPNRAAELLDSCGAAPAAARALDSLGYAPIATVYLRYQEAPRFEHVLQPLREDPRRQRFGQWVFDRGALDAAHNGIVSVVISGAGPHLDSDHATLARHVAGQLASELGLPQPLAHAVIVEKRATIIPVPGLRRPPSRLAPGLYLAGDAADSPYPSTLEGSVRAGEAAADACLEDLR